MSKDAAKEENGIPFGEPAIQTIAMPGKRIPSGDIFGGWLLSQMDLAAWQCRGLLRARALRDPSSSLIR